jgi:hypothetical protein
VLCRSTIRCQKDKWQKQKQSNSFWIWLCFHLVKNKKQNTVYRSITPKKRTNKDRLAISFVQKDIKKRKSRLQKNILYIYNFITLYQMQNSWLLSYNIFSHCYSFVLYMIIFCRKTYIVIKKKVWMPQKNTNFSSNNDCFIF